MRAATYGPQAETLLEFRIVRSDGQIRSIQGRGHSTQDADGNPIRVSGVFRDLTAYRAAQKEAKDLSRRILNIQDEERKQIAQELHDEVGQGLTVDLLGLKRAVDCALPTWLPTSGRFRMRPVEPHRGAAGRPPPTPVALEDLGLLSALAALGH